MTIAALTWPDAVVHATWIAAGAFVVAVLIWSIFRTGQDVNQRRHSTTRTRRQAPHRRGRTPSPARALHPLNSNRRTEVI
jgi:hypothetical protein